MLIVFKPKICNLFRNLFWLSLRLILIVFLNIPNSKIQCLKPAGLEKSPLHLIDLKRLYKYETGLIKSERIKYEEKIEQNEIFFVLKNISIYLQHHKFFDIDWREFPNTNKISGTLKPKKLQSKNELNKFMYQFPRPPLQSFDSGLRDSCEKNLLNCLNVINSKANSSVHVLNYSRRRKTKKKIIFDANEAKGLFKPFLSNLQQFKFRATSFYYLCWYTMRQHPLLKSFGQSCDWWFSKDFRADDTKPYNCALYSFCPDPCFGKVGLKFKMNKKNYAKMSPFNPCNGIGKGNCKINLVANTHFVDLISKNQIKIDCECEKMYRGYSWNTEYSLCVDRDECLSNSSICDKNEICENTVGSYECRCGWGYARINSTGECRRSSRDTNVTSKKESSVALIIKPDSTKIWIKEWKDAGNYLLNSFGYSFSASDGLTIHRKITYFIYLFLFESIVFVLNCVLF